MEIYLLPKFRLTVFVYIVLVLWKNENVFAGAIPEVSGNFMLVKMPDKNQVSNLLLVEKKDGLKSLIKIEEQTEGNTKTPNYFYGKLE